MNVLREVVLQNERKAEAAKAIDTFSALNASDQRYALAFIRGVQFGKTADTKPLPQTSHPSP